MKVVPDGLSLTVLMVNFAVPIVVFAIATNQVLQTDRIDPKVYRLYEWVATATIIQISVVLLGMTLYGLGMGR